MEYDQYLDQVPIGCQSIDEKGHIIHVNRAWTDYFGYHAEDVLGRNFGEFLAPGEIKNFLKHFMMLKTRGEIHRAELVVLHKDGSQQIVSIDGKVVSDSDSGMREALCFLSNITEQKRVENELRESREKYRKLIHNINDIVWQTNADAEFVYISPQVEQSLGYRADDMNGKKVFDFISADDLEHNKSVLSEAVDNKPKNITTDTKMIHRDGYFVTMESRASPLYDEENNFTGFIGVDRDVTERRRVEKALKEANKKLNLLSQVTRHDINNQIMALNAYLHLIGDEKITEECRDHLELCTSIVKEIENQILFTREYHEIGTIKPIWQNLDELIEKLRENFRVDISFVSDAGAIEIYADQMLEKVFFNLFSNSEYHGQKVRRIVVTFRNENGDGTILVQDDGIGIHADMKDMIFERGVGKKSGFGLFLSREILDITDISIYENGTFGEGARFEIHVPREGWRIAPA